MTDKRFKLKDIGFVYDNDKLIGMKEIVDLLNELNDENNHIKHLIKTMMENERTTLGKNVLYQLWSNVKGD